MRVEPYLQVANTDEDETSKMPMGPAPSCKQVPLTNFHRLAQDAPAEGVLASVATPTLGIVVILLALTLSFFHLSTHFSLIDNYLLSIVGEYLAALQHV